LKGKRSKRGPSKDHRQKGRKTGGVVPARSGKTTWKNTIRASLTVLRKSGRAKRGGSEVILPGKKKRS